MIVNSIKFGFYTSHTATRLCKFLLDPLWENSAVELVVHDGTPCDKLNRLCDENEIDLICVDYASLGVNGRERNEYISSLLLEQLSRRSADYCFCFGSRILVGRLLEVYKNRIINFHPSLLPSFPGFGAIDKALEYGSLVLGNTSHFIDEGLDSGPIIMQSMLPRVAFEGYDSLLDMQLPMLAQIIKWLIEDRIEVNGRVVKVHRASFEESSFMPNLEFERP